MSQKFQAKFKLKNGLQVLFVESHKSPVISIQMWVRTGSADEKKGEEGISHFIEHLVFKGTRNFKMGEIASIIEGSGGELNAYTSFDQTVFYVTISKSFVDTGLNAICEMMGFPLFDPQEIDNEREVVIEEIKRGNDSLGRRASQLLFSTAYKKHAYGIPVIGFDKNIRKMSAKKIKSFYQSRYSPENMFLVVTGDFDSKEMKQKVAKIYTDIAKHRTKKVKRVKEPKQVKPRSAVEESKFEQSISYLAWKVPSIKHKDTAALDVLALILGQGDSSRLVNKLRIEAPTVNSIGASVFSVQEEGLFTISMGYNKENFSQALKETQEQIADLFIRPPSEAEMTKAISNLESEQYYSLETVDGLARVAGNSEFLMKDPNYLDKYLAQVRKLKPMDIVKAAKKYLDPKTLSVATLTNANKKETEKLIGNFIKDYSVLAKTFKVPKKLPATNVKLPKFAKLNHGSQTETRKVKLASGVTVLLRPSEETHIISAKAAMLGGARLERADQEGLTELFGRTWMGGTKKQSEGQIYQEIEEIAAAMSPVAGRNSIGLGIEVLSPFEDKASDLFLDMLVNPTLPTDVMNRERSIQLEQIKSKNDNPSQLCIRDFMLTLFEGHPYAKDMIGSEQSVSKIKNEELKTFWQKHLFKSNTTLILAGRYDENLWLKKIEAATKSLREGSAPINKFPVGEVKDKIVFQKLEKEQSHLVYGFRGLTIHDDDRFALQVIQSILAGQGGRLFLELRDKNSLAYSVSPLRLEGLDTGYFGAYIGCSPDKVSKALQMMKEQFQLLCEKKVDDHELLRAKRYLMGRHDIDLQRTGSVASSILYDDIYGIDFNETFQMGEKYFAVTANDVQRVAQKIFNQKSVISLVGPSNPLK